MKITPEYTELNRRLHEQGRYGLGGAKCANAVKNIADAVKTSDVLDYGCGQRMLERSLPFPIRNYDPGIPGLDATPEPADIVVCTDVLEHIEPECLDDVLDDLKRVTRRMGFFVISYQPAMKTLPDGRNAHLIQQPPQWWLDKLRARFTLQKAVDYQGEFSVLVSPL
jgi:hypothetical protein